MGNPDTDLLIVSLEDLSTSLLDMCACSSDDNALSRKGCRQILQGLTKFASKLRKGLSQDELIGEDDFGGIGDLMGDLNNAKRDCKGN